MTWEADRQRLVLEVPHLGVDEVESVSEDPDPAAVVLQVDVQSAGQPVAGAQVGARQRPIVDDAIWNRTEAKEEADVN